VGRGRGSGTFRPRPPSPCGLAGLGGLPDLERLDDVVLLDHGPGRQVARDLEVLPVDALAVLPTLLADVGLEVEVEHGHELPATLCGNLRVGVLAELTSSDGERTVGETEALVTDAGEEGGGCH